MYEAIKGILTAKDPSRAVIETGNIFYRLVIPLNTYSKLPPLGSPTHLFLSHIVREDSQTLYAFLAKEERDLFEILIGISGIGPKTATAIIGHMEMNAFQRAITSADIHLLSKIPGIGKKTAERLVIEMRDKMKGKNKEIPLCASLADGTVTDAINALMNLGYSLLDAQKAVQSALQDKKEEHDLGNLITAALQKMYTHSG